MSTVKHSSEHPAMRLIGTLLRVWVVGFVLAANGTMWLIRKTLHLLPFRRSAPPDEHLIE
ncbi:MAG: hypothetical protein ACHQAQ_06400 [Hyphomicrobiales bacterium]|jgi:hypothetical protein